MPFTPKGGRFLEVHIKSDQPVKFLKEGFLERTYFAEPIGTFECGDPLLNRIWRTGVETVRACSEDAFVDCPTRERGQWTGDVASVATDIAAVAYSDLALSRRALVQAAQAARSDGLVAGVGPGDPGYLSTYAAQWVTACMHYWELTGDKSLLQELLPAARRNLGAFLAQFSKEGVSDNLGWAFVDWGYVRNSGPSDMALNMHWLRAVRDMARWEQEFDHDAARQTSHIVHDLTVTIERWLKDQIARPGGWSNVGYHRAALALLTDLVEPDQKKACIEYIKSHLLRCFPNDPTAPRLSDPSVSNDRIMTPFFAHFSFSALLEAGEIDFVLGQYRKCWGWALGGGRTTWLEVFDTRWSHCHEWSGAPTWQLSRYVLGLQPRLDLSPNTYELNIQPGSLKSVSGIVPTPDGNAIRVSWKRQGNTIKLTIDSPDAITVRLSNKTLEIKGRAETTIPVPNP